MTDIDAHTSNPDPHPELEEEDPDYAARFRELAYRADPMRATEPPAGVDSSHSRLIIALAVIAIGVIGTVGFLFMQGRNRPEGVVALSTEEAIQAVVGYAPCKGGPTLGTIVDRSVGLAGATEGRSVQILENSPLADNIRVAFIYKTAAKSIIFAYHPKAGDMTPEGADAAAALNRLERLCASSSGALDF